MSGDSTTTCGATSASSATARLDAACGGRAGPLHRTLVQKAADVPSLSVLCRPPRCSPIHAVSRSTSTGAQRHHRLRVRRHSTVEGCWIQAVSHTAPPVPGRRRAVATHARIDFHHGQRDGEITYTVMSESTYGASQRTSRSRSTRLEAMVRERAAAYRTSVPWEQARRFDLLQNPTPLDVAPGREKSGTFDAPRGPSTSLGGPEQYRAGPLAFAAMRVRQVDLTRVRLRAWILCAFIVLTSLFSSRVRCSQARPAPRRPAS